MKVALIGMAPGWERAPWDDPSWERWGLNDGYAQHDSGHVCTAWWEIHGDTPLTRARREPDHWERLRELGRTMPIYYFNGDPPAPSAIRIDPDALASVWRDYFACTMAYQMAYALLHGATEIGLYGMPLMGPREIVVERPCVAAWIGFAEGRGVRVIVEHDEAMGLLHHPYRYAQDDWMERVTTYTAVARLNLTINYWLQAEISRLVATVPQHERLVGARPLALVEDA